MATPSIPKYCENLTDSPTSNLNQYTQMLPVTEELLNCAQTKHNTMTTHSTHDMKIHEATQTSSVNRITTEPTHSRLNRNASDVMSQNVELPILESKIFDGARKKIPTSESSLRPLERSERVNFEEIGKTSSSFSDSHTSHQPFGPFATNTHQSPSLFLDNMRSTAARQPSCGSGPAPVTTPYYRSQPILSSTTCPMYTAAVYSWTRTHPCVSTSLQPLIKGVRPVLLILNVAPYSCTLGGGNWAAVLCSL